MKKLCYNKPEQAKRERSKTEKIEPLLEEKKNGGVYLWSDEIFGLADFYKLRSKFACVFFEVGASFIANGRLLYFFVAVYLRNGFIAKLFFSLYGEMCLDFWTRF